jgi:hypothetical protein
LQSFITSISVWTQAGCKNASNDPHAKELGDSFTNSLPGWCATKKAGAIFFWLAFGEFLPVKWIFVAKMFNTVFWGGSLTLTFLEWRKNRASRPRDPPFELPRDGEEGDEESAYEVPSLKQDEDDTSSPFSDAYRYSGASSTAIGSFGSPTSPKYNIPSAPQPRPSLDAYGAFSDPAPTGFGGSPVDSGVTGVSRTMLYADPYAAVRASVTSGPTQSSPDYQ